MLYKGDIDFSVSLVGGEGAVQGCKSAVQGYH